MRSQVHKHNKRLLRPNAILYSVYGEQQTGSVVANFIPGQEIVGVVGNFESIIQKTTIDLNDFHNFLQSNTTSEDLIELRSSDNYKSNQADIALIVSGVDIWSDRSAVAQEIKLKVKTTYGAHPSTQHNNERCVKIASRMS